MDHLALAIVGCGGTGRRHVHGLADPRQASARVGEQSLLHLTAVIDTAANRAAGQWTNHRAGHGQPRSLRKFCGSSGSIELPADPFGGAPILVSDDGKRITGHDLLTLVPDFELPPVEAAIWGSPRRSHFAGDFAAIDRRLVAVELHDFARAVATDTPPEVDGEAGRRNMALVYAVARVGRRGPASHGRSHRPRRTPRLPGQDRR